MSNRKKGYLLILLTAMLYSTTEIALKLLGGAFEPMQLTCERVLVGGFFMLPFALRDMKRRGIRPDQSDWGYFALLGFLTVMLHMSFLQLAVMHMDASASAAIYSGNPVFAILAAHFLLREPVKKNHLLAIALEVTGILFILNPLDLELSPRGFIEILCATVLFSMYGTLCKLRLKKLGSIVIACFNMLLGGTEMLAILLLGRIPAVAMLYEKCGLSLLADISLVDGFTLRSTLLMFYAGIFCAGFGFLLTAKITEYTSAIEASFTYLLKPPLATALAVLVFHEVISVNRIIGIVFFMAASLCVSVPVLLEMKKEKMSAS